jgi:hypothetical protein
MKESEADYVALLIQQAFRYAHGGIQDITGIVGASQPAGEIRNELLSALARIKAGDTDVVTLSEFDAKLRTAQVMGMIDEEKYNQITKSMEEI